ncbi:peptidoglycan DD-metalloendopeptidase family protein [Bacillus sp. REN10]|uniref:murein hydrolase activator EnvC family protein n=1 Tax=Bacillus sp. REN10 TaxID=2782541 RepID=UPI001EEF1140|nr:peptidoglycan DD-metalloendopeptidase family protein [Bacillus sp. REN10]
MKKRVGLTVALMTSLSVSGTFGATGEAAASTLSDLESRQHQIQNKQSDLEKSITEKNNKINELQGQQDKLAVEIKKLDDDVTKAESSIREKQEKIAQTKTEIAKLQTEIEELKKRIEERNVILDDRARSLQKSGGSASYVDVILGAKSFGDFVNRATAVTTLVNADKEILQEQETDKAQLEENEKQVKEKLANLEGMLQSLETLKAELEQKKAAKDQVMKSLASEENEIHHDKLSLEEEKALLSSQDASIKEAIAAEKERLAKEEQQRPAPSSGSTAAPEVSTTNRSDDKPVVTSGTFMRPAEGRVSSEFGYRDLGDHKGIDIANKTSVPIVAAADGVVSRSYYSSSYGNVIFISHSINGQVLTTVYAHMSERLVESGHVSKGQTIGYMGNTGHSFGQHLHFEVHEGPWTPSKSHAVDPRKYVNF